jgi:prolyl 4-hydroxylase
LTESKDMIIQVDNALTAASCQRLMALYDRYAEHASGEDYTFHRVVHCSQDVPAAELGPVKRLVERARRRAVAALAPGETIYTETVVLAAIGPGGRHPQHSDNSEQDDAGDWVPNHTPQRALSALCYLNDGFEGGELVFETQGVVVKPRRGLFVAFPSDERFMHEVLPVRAGRRYSLALWFTRQPAFALPGFAPRFRG